MREAGDLTRTQFRVLYRVFLLRVIDLELLSADGDTTKLLGQFAAVLAAVSFMFTAPLVLVSRGGLDQETVWTMEHLLIATTMLVAGSFAVLSWDSIFPERQDVLILTPLPVRGRVLFLAKLAASGVALGVGVAALNVFSGLVWPLVFFPASNGVLHALRSFVAYWVTILMAACFIFCFVLTIRWVAEQVLPRQLFLRLSALLQVGIVCLLLGVYLLEPSLESAVSLAAPQNQRLLAWLPSYWFLGLFQVLHGSAFAEFARLAGQALRGFAIALVGAGVGVLLSYLVTLRRAVEEPDIVPGARRMGWSLGFARPLDRAIMLFGARTLLRNRHHRVILSFYLGVGFAVALAYLTSQFGQHWILHGRATTQVNVALMAASLLMMCIAVTGVRIVLSLPVALRANWIFQITEIRSVSAYVDATRWTLLLLAVSPVWLAFATLFLLIDPLWMACRHLVLLWLLGVIVTEMCLRGFEKIPLTCSYLPGKANIQYVFWSFVLLLPLSYTGAKFEAIVLQRPACYLLLAVILCFIGAALRRRTSIRSKTAAALMFDESQAIEVMGLGLRIDGELLMNGPKDES